ncbi:hypothetical protein STEG23_013895 [Scotinomys teguina]
MLLSLPILTAQQAESSSSVDPGRRTRLLERSCSEDLRSSRVEDRTQGLVLARTEDRTQGLVLTRQVLYH